jgi:hypothetical protein
MIEQEKCSFDDHVSFDARWMQLEIPLNVNSITNTATDKPHSEFEDHRAQDERNTPQTDWPFLAFWVSYAAGIVFIAVWALT